MATTVKHNKGLLAGLVTAIAASLCCITPVLAFLGGVSGLATTFSWIEPYRPYLIAVTVFVFALAWYQRLKPQKQIDCNCEADIKGTFWQSRTLLGIVTLLAVLLVSFPYYAKAFYPKTVQSRVAISNKADIKEAVFKIKGMGCEGCTEEINTGIAKIKGVIQYQTSFKTANCIVRFDSSKTSADRIAEAINAVGYRVTSQKVSSN
jgi:copper chaperone CopZ